MIASCGLLESELRQLSREGVTLADSMDTLGVDLKTRVKKLGAKEKTKRKKCKVRFSHIKKNTVFERSYIRGSKVVFQKIRVLVQRSFQSSLRTPCSVCASSQSHRFHNIQILVLAHHGQTHVQRFVRLSAIRDRFPKLSRCTCCLDQPFLSCVVKETKPVTKYPQEVPPFPSVSREI